MVIDGLALTHKYRFGAKNLSQWDIPTDDGAGTNFVAGDLCVVCQAVINSGASIPSSVTPSGWTNLMNSVVLTNGNGDGMRMNSQYKIMTAADIGSTVTGMAGTAFNQICAMIMHFNRPVQSVTRVTAANLVSLALGTTNTGSVAWDSVAGNHLYLGFAHGDGNGGGTVSDSNFTWTNGPFGGAHVQVPPNPAPPDNGPVTNTRVYYSYFQHGANPTASETMSMTIDTGAFNGVTGMLLRLT